LIRNCLDWSDKGKPAIGRYVVAVVLGLVFWMWGSFPVILLLQVFFEDPATSPTAFECTFII